VRRCALASAIAARTNNLCGVRTPNRLAGRLKYEKRKQGQNSPLEYLQAPFQREPATRAPLQAFEGPTGALKPGRKTRRQVRVPIGGGPKRITIAARGPGPTREERGRCRRRAGGNARGSRGSSRCWSGGLEKD